jgi:hypothetical protein
LGDARTREFIGQTLYIEASDNFWQAEKLYLQDGATWHDLCSSPLALALPIQCKNDESLLGNLQPKATIGYQPNRIYQGGTTASLAGLIPIPSWWIMQIEDHQCDQRDHNS